MFGSLKGPNCRRGAKAQARRKIGMFRFIVFVSLATSISLCHGHAQVPISSRQETCRVACQSNRTKMLPLIVSLLLIVSQLERSDRLVQSQISPIFLILEKRFSLHFARIFSVGGPQLEP